MIPLDKVKNIIKKYEALEKELSLEANDKKLFVKKSKEYASFREIINEAKFYVNFEIIKSSKSWSKNYFLPILCKTSISSY